MARASCQRNVIRLSFFGERSSALAQAQEIEQCADRRRLLVQLTPAQPLADIAPCRSLPA